MRQAIVLTPTGGFASAEIEARLIGGSVLKGQRIVVTDVMDFGPYGLVLVGDTGCVTYVNLVSGEVQITVDRYIPAMRDWENSFTLMPYQTDALLTSLRCASPLRLGRLAAC